MLVLLALGIGIAQWMTAPTEHPRLDYLHIHEDLAAMEEETAMLKRALKEFPSVVMEALRPRSVAEMLQNPGPAESILVLEFVRVKPYPGIDPAFELSRTLTPEVLLEEYLFRELAKRLHTDARRLQEKFYQFACMEAEKAPPGDLRLPLGSLGSVQHLRAFAEAIALLNARSSLPHTTATPSPSPRR